MGGAAFELGSAAEAVTKQAFWLSEGGAQLTSGGFGGWQDPLV